MDARPRIADLTFHGVEAGGSWDLIYDEGGDTVRVGRLLPVHSG